MTRKDAATARRLGPSAWRDDWMPATKETLMDEPEPWRPDAIDDVIANWLAMSDYAHARDAYTAAQNLRGVLDSWGYTIARRASQAATGPRTPGDDAGAAHDPHGAAQALSEPHVHYEIETRFRGRWQTVTAAPDLDEAREFAALSDCDDRIVRVTREAIQ